MSGLGFDDEDDGKPVLGAGVRKANRKSRGVTKPATPSEESLKAGAALGYDGAQGAVRRVRAGPPKKQFKFYLPIALGDEINALANQEDRRAVHELIADMLAAYKARRDGG